MEPSRDRSQMCIKAGIFALSFQVEVILRAVSPKTEQNDSQSTVSPNFSLTASIRACAAYAKCTIHPRNRKPGRRWSSDRPPFNHHVHMAIGQTSNLQPFALLKKSLPAPSHPHGGSGRRDVVMKLRPGCPKVCFPQRISEACVGRNNEYAMPMMML